MDPATPQPHSLKCLRGSPKVHSILPNSAKRTEHCLISPCPAVWQALRPSDHQCLSHFPVPRRSVGGDPPTPPPLELLRSVESVQLFQLIWAVERVGQVPEVALGQPVQPQQTHAPRATLQTRATHQSGQPVSPGFRYTSQRAGIEGGY